jgi:uncharacterized repeat protein (TIGR01451 family)
MNPALYTIATEPIYTNCFHDITTGNNTWSGSPNQFFAVPNYDLCTGLGTPNGTNLINELTTLSLVVNHISPPPPPYGTNLAILQGGNPNGTWELFVQDDAPISSGYISNGWVLTLTTADIVGTVGDLELLMSTTNTSVLSGQPVTFVLTVTNYGPSVSTNVTVVNNLPSTVTLQSTNATQGSVGRTGSTLTWNVGTLAVGSGAGLVITVQTHSVGAIVNSATASAGTPDPNSDDDSASASVNVGSAAPTTLVPAFVSSNKTFQITVSNPPGVTVVIQANSNLISTNWVNVYTGTPPFTFTDPAASNYVSRFYRAQILP